MEPGYLRRELELGVSTPATLLSFSTLSSFHVAVEDDSGRKMRNMLENALIRFGHTHAARHPILVTPSTTSVVVEIGPGCLWRVEVRHPVLHDDYVIVDIVDAGCARKVNMASVFHPTQELLDIPCLSHRCALEGVMEKRDDVSCEFLLRGQRLEIRMIDIETSGVLHVACTSFGYDIGLLAVLHYDMAVFEEPKIVLREDRKFPELDLMSLAGVKSRAVSRRLLDNGELILQHLDLSDIDKITRECALVPISDNNIGAGKLVLGKSRETNYFMRAEILEVVPSTLFPTYLVYFVDIAEKAYLRKELLMELPQELVAFPACSQPVAIDDLNGCSLETENDIRPLLQQSFVYFTVVDQTGGKPVVQIDLATGPEDYRGIRLRQIVGKREQE